MIPANDPARRPPLSPRAEPGQREALRACVDRVVAARVPTIEALGGGSVRCMLAEIFLPHAAPAGPVADDGDTS